MKQSKLYNTTKLYAATLGVDIFDVTEFRLFTKHGKYINTVTFKKMCDMILDKCVFLSQSKHTPKISYYKRDYRIAERYERAGFTVYCLSHKNFILFSELYFEYQEVQNEEQL